MKRLDDGDTYQLSSGRTFSANCGVIGLCPGVTQVGEGFDGGITVRDEWALEGERWTDEEVSELRQFMIDAWTNWKP